MNAINLFPQSQQGASASPINPPNGYRLGTRLHGNNTKIGNLWIITIDNSLQASLLYNGKTKSICADPFDKQDTMSLGMRVAADYEVLLLIGSWNNYPNWANITSLMINPILPTSKATPLFGIDMATYDQWKVGHYSPMCSARKDKPCSYTPYYGFTENYEYCRYCDQKRDMLK